MSESDRLPTTQEPAKAIFFTAGLVSVILNIFIIFVLRSKNISSEPTSINIDGWIYLVGVVLGVRHFLRIDIIDFHVSKITASRSLAILIYNLLFFGTIVAAISFTATIGGSDAYLLSLILYFSIFILLEANLMIRANLPNNYDHFISIALDILSIVTIYMLYQFNTGVLIQLDMGFYLILLGCLICIILELKYIHSTSLMHRFKEAGNLLFNTPLIER